LGFPGADSKSNALRPHGPEKSGMGIAVSATVETDPIDVAANAPKRIRFMRMIVSPPTS